LQTPEDGCMSSAQVSAESSAEHIVALLVLVCAVPLQ
jgi:hypothetical protein